MEKVSLNAIRFRIMSIALLGGLGFFLYFIQSYSVADRNNAIIQETSITKFTVLQEINNIRNQLDIISDSFMQSVELADQQTLSEADVALHKIQKNVQKIIELDGSQQAEFVSFEETLLDYYNSEKAIIQLLLGHPDNLQKNNRGLSENRPILLETKKHLNEIYERDVSLYAGNLSNVSQDINQFISIGFYFGFSLIAGLALLVWFVSVSVCRQIKKGDKAKNDFYASISHELRTPMNGVVSSLQLMEMSDLNDEIKPYVQIATESANDMNDMIDALLEYTEVRSGELKLINEPFSVKEMIKRLQVKFEPRCRAKGISFHVDTKQLPDTWLLGDGTQYRRALVNLLDNAVKFTESGSVSLIIDCHPCKDNRHRMLLEATVQDTGIGFSPEVRDDIFQSFRQLDGSLRRRYNGMGIGLTATSLLVNMLGGELDVESWEGQGSRFSLCVSFDKIAPQASPVISTQEESQEKVQLDVSPLILVVEDNPVNQKVLTATLKKMGYKYLTANNGQEAIDLLQKEKTDLILMDCQMPILDGFAATESIRSREGVENEMPIIAVTANAMSGDRKKCLDSGMNDYIKKPINKDVLREKIEKFLKRPSKPHVV